MQTIYASHAASISELKRNPSQLISQAEGEPIAILNHNIATAYLIPASTFEKILDELDELDELHLQEIVKQRLSDNKKFVRVTLDEL